MVGSNEVQILCYCTQVHFSHICTLLEYLCSRESSLIDFSTLRRGRDRLWRGRSEDPLNHPMGSSDGCPRGRDLINASTFLIHLFPLEWSRCSSRSSVQLGLYYSVWNLAAKLDCVQRCLLLCTSTVQVVNKRGTILFVGLELVSFCWVIIRGVVCHSCSWLESERSKFNSLVVLLVYWGSEALVYSVELVLCCPWSSDTRVHYYLNLSIWGSKL